MRDVVRLGAVSGAGARVESVIAPVVPSARLAALGQRVRGLLGQDFLSAFNYTLDYRHHHLTWDEDDAVCGEPSAVRLVASDGRFVMALPQGGSRRALRLVPDAGAEALVLFERRGDELPAGAKTLNASLELYPVAGAALPGDVLVKLALVAAGQQQPEIERIVTPETADGALRAEAEFPVERLAPGTYSIQATVMVGANAIGTASATFTRK